MNRPSKVLIVEDDPSVSDWLALFADRLGYEVEVTDSGEEALLIFQRDRPDLVTLDLLLPGMDGLDTLKALKRIAQRLNRQGQRIDKLNRRLARVQRAAHMAHIFDIEPKPAVICTAQ